MLLEVDGSSNGAVGSMKSISVLQNNQFGFDSQNVCLGYDNVHRSPRRDRTQTFALHCRSLQRHV